MATLITAIAVLVAVLVLTKAGREIDAATQRFMLYYAGVLALVGLTGSVLLGLLATDRIVMTPGHRVMAQAVHRAFSFGTLAFLVIHIVTEILAQRSHVIDAVVPFLSPYRTFYIGLGTIASDLIVLLVVTSIVRKRFTEHGKAWRWRAIHYASYVAFVFGVLHGLLGGRTAKPYVDWSYGFAIAVTALGLAVRFLAISLRPKESLPSSPSADRARAAGSSSLHAAAMGLAQARLGGGIGGTVQVLPAGLGGQGAADSWAALPAPGWSPASGPLPALGPAPPYAGSPADDYRDLGFMPLGAPPYGDDGSAGMRARPYVSADQARSAPSGPARQPLYEPGYDGPPRFEGAPRGHGDIPQDELSSYPYGPRDRRPASPYAEDYPDRQGSGPRGIRPGMAEPARPRAALPAPPRRDDRNSGPIPQLRTGPMTSARPGTDAPARHGPVAAGWSGAAAAQRDRSGYGTDAACGHGPHAPGRLGSHAAPGHRPDAPGRLRPHAPGRLGSHAPLGHRPDAPSGYGPVAAGWSGAAAQRDGSRYGADAAYGHRPHAALGHGADAPVRRPSRYRPDAPARHRGEAAAPRRRSDAALGNRPYDAARKRPDAPSGHRPDAPPQSHAPSRSAVAGWRPGYRSARRPAAADSAARVTPGQAH